MKKALYPFLLATFPILSLYAHNISEVAPFDLFLPLLATLTVTLVLLLILRLATRSYAKAALITTFFLLLFFSYGYVRNSIYLGHPFALPSIWIVLFLLGTFFVFRTCRTFNFLTKLLNITAIALIVISVASIGVGALGKPSYTPTTETSSNLTAVKAPESPRDIYYIILDTYARQDSLAEVYGYDNSRFANYLASKGFYVASESNSNYPSTHLALASSLNMRYLEEEEKVDSILFEMIGNNEVSRLLEGAGYRYIFISGGWNPKAVSGYTDEYLVYRSNSLFKKTAFIESLITTTALTAVRRLTGDFFAPYNRAERLHAFEAASTIPDIEEPTFTYIHIMSPHPPFIFDREGNSPKRNVFEEVGSIWQAKNVERYVDQLIFINKKAESLIDAILKKSDTPPIIILQGDHGMWWIEDARFKILNAYYLPGHNPPLYESISPVNTFRMVFNLYFGTDYDLLEDRSYEKVGK